MMNDAPDAEREPSPYIRLPLPVVAGAIVLVLAGLLALGLYANTNLRQGSSVAPTPVAAAQPTAAPPTSIPAAATSTMVPAATPTPAPTSLILTNLASPTPAPPPATAPPVAESPTPLPTVEPVLAAEVGKAYENFWRVRSQAALTLDASKLPDVMDGPYLQHFIDVLNQLRQEGRAIQTKVTLDYTVVQAADDSAIVHDRVQDRSYYVRLGTDAPLDDPANGVLLIEFTLAKLDGLWKVVDSVTER